MALTLLAHPDLTLLAERFCADLANRPAGLRPFDKEYLIVQTPGLGKWLTLEAARRNRIFTLVETQTPTQFIMKLGFLVRREREERTIFERDVLPWVLVRVLSEELPKPNSPLALALGHIRGGSSATDQQLRLFSLAEELARMFDDYLLYRPDWLDAWEQNQLVPDMVGDGALDHQRWQGWLWRRLLEFSSGPDRSRAGFFDRIEQGMRELVADPTRRHYLPQRLFLFGMSVLPPRYLQLFSELGNLIEVRFYLQQPSYHYYGDLDSDRLITRARLAGQRRIHGLDGNRLLANLGRLAADFLDLVLETGPREVELYSFEDLNLPDGPLSILAEVQTAVRHCLPAPTEPVDRPSADPSLQLAACPGPQREVEVLHDWLLTALADLPGLNPADILVVTPDPATYGPLVKLVFAQAADISGARLPVTVADLATGALDERPQLLLDLLEAATGRFDLASLLPLFERWSEAQGQPLSVRERQNWADWTTRAGIRWGVDGEFRRQLNLPAEPVGTWRHGLDRLWAAWATDSDQLCGPDLLGEPGPDGSAGATGLGRLAHFISTLAEVAALLAESLPLPDWVDRLRPLLSRWWPETADSDEGSDPLGQAFGALLERSALSGAADLKFGGRLLIRQLAAELESAVSHGRFLTGSITVAGMLPMRSIPFRIIAVLGLNRGDFPRHFNHPTFDLLGTNLRRGDPDLLGGDRYLFLETLLAAQDRCLITWSETATKGPSVLVDLLREDLDRRLTIAGQAASQALVYHHPLHPFSARYLQAGAPPTWNRAWFEATEPPPSAAELLAWRVPDRRSEDRLIDNRQLVQALADPQAWFVSQGLGASEPHEQDLLPTEETFALDALQEWQVRQAILDSELGQDRLALRRIAEQGVLPPGAPGQAASLQQDRKLRSRLERLSQLFPQPEFTRHRQRIEDAEVHWLWTEEQVAFRQGPEGRQLLLIDGGKLNAKRRLRHLTAHLFANLTTPTVSHFLALDETSRLRPLAAAAARAHLRDLDALRREAETRCLPLFPDLAWSGPTETKLPTYPTVWQRRLLGSVEDLAEWWALHPGLEADATALADRLWRAYRECHDGE